MCRYAVVPALLGEFFGWCRSCRRQSSLEYARHELLLAQRFVLESNSASGEQNSSESVARPVVQPRSASYTRSKTNMKPQELALITRSARRRRGARQVAARRTAAAKSRKKLQRQTAALRARVKEIQARKAMARRPKRARPTAAKRYNKTTRWPWPYGGSQEAVDVAARARGAPRPSISARLDEALRAHDGTAGVPESSWTSRWWGLEDARQPLWNLGGNWRTRSRSVDLRSSRRS